jgi:hypothetical protein
MEIWEVKVVLIDLLLKSLVLPTFIAMIGKEFEAEFCCRPCLLQNTPHNVTQHYIQTFPSIQGFSFGSQCHSSSIWLSTG